MMGRIPHVVEAISPEKRRSECQRGAHHSNGVHLAFLCGERCYFADQAVGSDALKGGPGLDVEALVLGSRFRTVVLRAFVVTPVLLALRKTRSDGILHGVGAYLRGKAVQDG